VFKYEAFPNTDELALFYYNRYIGADKVKTLPFETQKWTAKIMSNYKPYFEKM
jgi:hypothetical protein